MSSPASPRASYPLVTALTYAMFFMFAMTTDAVGEIIKIAKSELGLSNTEAAAFHWATMIAIAGSGAFLGFLADRIGRKRAIILGLFVYGIASALFYAGKNFQLYLTLLFISGLAIGVFKTAALALIGDISRSTRDHTAKMNAVEGFFGIGAIVGPLLVVQLNARGMSWTYLYLVAAALCVVMIIAALITEYPPTTTQQKEKSGVGSTLALLGNKYAVGFSLAIAMYVACEVAIFVWLPTFLEGYQGTELSMWFAAYAVMIFFILRAAGRFLGIWILSFIDWKVVMLVFTGVIFACFVGSALLGQKAALFLLPLSGLFMSMIYPTLNSKGISCLPKAQHGAAAGLILFFTAASAAVAPLLMGVISDHLGEGDMRIGFVLATAFAAILFVMMLFNFVADPAGSALASADRDDYEKEATA